MTHGPKHYANLVTKVLFLFKFPFAQLLNSTGYSFIDPTLLMSAQYGFYDDELEEENDRSMLGTELNKEMHDEHSEDKPPKLVSDNSTSSKNQSRLNLKETEVLKQGLEDPTTRQKVLKLMQEQSCKLT